MGKVAQPSRQQALEREGACGTLSTEEDRFNLVGYLFGCSKLCYIYYTTFAQHMAIIVPKSFLTLAEF
jgi:hypothetical protein